MAFGPDITWCMWTSCVIIAIMLAVCAVLRLHEAGVYPLRDITKLIRRPGFEVALILFMVGGLVQYGATKGTNGTDRAGQPRRVAPSSAATGGVLSEALTNEIGQVTSLCFTGIAPLSNSVRLDVAWPTNFFRDGTILDFFAKVGALTNEWNWIGMENVLPETTNTAIEIPYPAGVQIPAVMFFTVRDRYVSAATMSDDDLDGLPGFYELHYGTNPYVADSEYVPRITVGANGDYPTVEAALAASTDYSIVELNGETFEVSKWIVMPSHPVLLEGPRTGYAVLRSSAEVAAVMLTDGQDARTMIRNLIVELRAKRSFQAGFWVGGNTPWTGQGSAATFENVHVRAPYPGVEHFGWLFYRNEAGVSCLSGCTMNAAGSTWAYGVSMFNAASNVIEDCAFLNMPTSVMENTPIAVLIRNSTNVVVNLQVPEVRSDLSWAGYPISASYDSSADSDGDGISDYDEVFTYDTDPWLPDSDGDGIDDGNEIEAGTDPEDIVSHPQEFVISVTNTVLYADVTNYVFHGSVEGWESNLLFGCSEYGGRTNICMDTLFNASWMGAFRDLNRNGAFDSDADILRTNDVSGIEAVKTVNFAFGDVDGDGVDDMQERTDGTDPYSRLSVRISRKIKIENKDPASGITNYYFIGASPDWTSANWMWSMGNTVKPEGIVSGCATDGCLYAVVYRDFNCNGVFDEGLDAISTNKIVSGSGTLTFTIGDADGDGVEDGCEIADGMNPLDGNSYCYQAILNVTGIFETTNVLFYQVTFGDSVVIPATVVTTNALVLSLGHHATTNRESLAVWFWDDRDGDGIRDEDEACSSISVRHTGHSVNTTVSLPYGGFDADRNGLLDWWEVTTGLSEVDGAHGDTDDNDHDGLINLHEYWAGTDPLTPDGSNTLLSVCARSIDDRISGKSPDSSLELLTHYLENANELRFERNEDNWLADVDLTGMGVWTEQWPSNQRAPVAISSNHVMLATHWPVDVGKKVWFVDRNGDVVSNEIKMIRSVALPGHSIWDVDVSVALLKEPLPASISVVRLFPESIRDKLGNGKRIPVVQVNQEKEARVAELMSLELSGTKHNSYTFLTQPWRRGFSKAIRDGDSGSPTFAIVGNQPVLLGLHHTAGSDPAYWALGEEIQAAMDALSPTNRILLQTLDISQYPDLRRFP